MLRNRWLRLGATLLVTGLAAAYIVSKINLGQTAHTIGSADPRWLLLSAFLTVVTVPPRPGAGSCSCAHAASTTRSDG